jgi:hypothetical protein
MGSTHFQMKTFKHVGTEMALHVLAYNMKRVISILVRWMEQLAFRPALAASVRKMGYVFLAEFEKDVSPAFRATIVKTGGSVRRCDKFSAPVFCVIHLRARYGLALSIAAKSYGWE